MEIPSAPPQSDEESEDESLIPMTPNTANVENMAAIVLDAKTIPPSLIKNERIVSYLWLTFIFIYWTPCIWFPILYQESFYASPGFIFWCFGCTAIMAASYLLKEGKYPSGSTAKRPTQTNGAGRYTAVGLVLSILVDLVVRIFDVNNTILPDPMFIDMILMICHTIAIFWCSFFYYNRFKQINPEIATVSFLSEWIDIGMSCLTFIILVSYYDNACDANYLCWTYFISIPVEMILWILPMMIIRSWGTTVNGKAVSMQLFISNLLTDLPIIIVITQTGLYSVYLILFIDLLFKTFILIRGISYYMTFNIWLNRGKITKIYQSQTKSKTQKKQQVSESEMIALKDPKINVEQV